MIAQLCRHLIEERVLRGVEFFSPRGDAREECADSYVILDLCLGEGAPYSLVDSFTGAASVSG